MSEHDRSDEMREYQVLGDALRERLHALVADVNPSADLSERVDAIPSARASVWQRALDRVRRRRILLVVPVPLAAIAATLVAILGGSPAPTTAGGIMRLPNGFVSVSTEAMMNVAAANAELRHYGIHNIVVVPMTASCPRQAGISYIESKRYPEQPIRFDPTVLRRGWTSIVAAKVVGRNLLLIASDQFKGHVPNCISSRAFNGQPPSRQKAAGSSKKTSH